MNEHQFQHCVTELSADQLLSLKSGYTLCLVDDQTLSVEKGVGSNLLEVELLATLADAESIRRYLYEQAQPLIKQYYRTHPLTQSGFNQQVLALVRQYGAENFAAQPGQTALKTLFVDDGEVVAERSGQPRHAYGAYCELDSVAVNRDAESLVMQWITSGEAYRQYLSMNVCRYNC